VSVMNEIVDLYYQIADSEAVWALWRSSSFIIKSMLSRLLYHTVFIPVSSRYVATQPQLIVPKLRMSLTSLARVTRPKVDITCMLRSVLPIELNLQGMKVYYANYCPFIVDIFKYILLEHED
jgi:hypothetical protein